MIRWAEPEAVSNAVSEWAQNIRRARAEVRRIYWYGSWVGGMPTPRSDADLCVVVSEHRAPRRDRIPDYLPDGFPVGVDLIVLTEEELSALADRSPSWHHAITSGRQF